jgi:ribosomal protein S18 acetylase RimI-like enzyme
MGLYDRSLTYSRQVQTAYHDGGTGHVVFSVAKKMLWPVCRFGYLMFFERDLTNFSMTERKISSIRLTVLSPRDCYLLSSSRPGDPHVVAHAMERFDKGDQCFAAIAPNNDVAHSRWVSTNDTFIPELQMRTRPRANEAYMYDGYSKPEYRGRGIDGTIRNFIFETMKSQGIQNIYSYVRSDNPVGIRAARRWQTQIGRVWYLHFRDTDALVLGHRNTGMPLLIHA